MSALQTHFHFFQCSGTPPKLYNTRNSTLIPSPRNPFSGKIRICNSPSRHIDGVRQNFCCLCRASSDIEAAVTTTQEDGEKMERPPFDINLAVILAGFAFEAYTNPPENVGKREVDAANCKAVFLSEFFIREIYDGQLFIKLKKGSNFPAMDPWGTSDPYVVIQFDSQVIKSNTKWGTKDPTWNEEFNLNIKLPPTKDIQIAAWDANLVTPHKRMGNAVVSLESICDGNLHEVLVDLEGMGGGGKIQLEVRYKSFEQISREKKWWIIPVVEEFIRRSGFESALKKVVGSETVQAREFVQYAFGQLKSLNDAYFQTDQISGIDKSNRELIRKPGDPVVQLESSTEISLDDTSYREDNNLKELHPKSDNIDNEESSSIGSQVGEGSHSDKDFWKKFADTVTQNVVKKFGLPPPEKIKWDQFDVVSKIGVQSQTIAEASYVEFGLATPKGQEEVVSDDDVTNAPLAVSTTQSSFPDMKKITQDLLRQTDSVLGALMVLNTTVSQLNKDGFFAGMSDAKDNASTAVDNDVPLDGSVLDERKAEEMRELFSTAETAMEAWAMLATSLGHPTFIKSEFEKICFLDNPTTDTQVAIWRDSERKRLVVAFRGTEQTRWKDLMTDLMLVPAGLNPERIGGDFKQEVQVHSGFLSAYDSVRSRMISLIKLAVGYTDDSAQPLSKWHIYVTGHSLGGALATLLALELSSSQLAKRGAISVTMYNFGSPRVGNKKFAEVYNKKVKDSWRVVNHRDIIPTVPRLMGYCHVAQPVYLAAGNVKNALENLELLEDGYDVDVLGESTPDVLVNEFMKGEKELIEKILNTEINIFRSIRDGTALMQHMEDFYYISLLEVLRLLHIFYSLS
ncbi:hypothetical protein LguiA_030436 [Lonicera macranthoides]